LGKKIFFVFDIRIRAGVEAGLPYGSGVVKVNTVITQKYAFTSFNHDLLIEEPQVHQLS
jgi:hypothetical protein